MILILETKETYLLQRGMIIEIINLNKKMMMILIVGRKKKMIKVKKTIIVKSTKIMTMTGEKTTSTYPHYLRRTSTMTGIRTE